jgi:hypothetical protein
VRRWLLAAAYICGSIIGVFAAYAISPILGYLAILPATVFIWAAIGGTYRRLLGDKDTTADVMKATRQEELTEPHGHGTDANVIVVEWKSVHTIADLRARCATRVEGLPRDNRLCERQWTLANSGIGLTGIP